MKTIIQLSRTVKNKNKMRTKLINPKITKLKTKKIRDSKTEKFSVFVVEFSEILEAKLTSKQKLYRNNQQERVWRTK